LGEIFLTKTVDEWMEVLRREDVPSAPVNTMDRVMKDPQLFHRNMVVEVGHPAGGSFKAMGNPVKASGVDEIFHHPPALGEHTEEILRGLLGYSSQRIQDLMEKKIVMQPVRGEQSKKKEG
jgi:crotonobetainyl-CoA:carnitine CoA-transferase CaiB-like acyl-CoA transferase